MIVIGGTGFIGPPLVRDLLRDGHEVTVFHRGNAPVPRGAQEILGDRKRLRDFQEPVREFAPEVVIDLILSSEAQARDLMHVCRGVARRVVVASSMDVYRAFGVLHGLDTGPLEPLPLTEESALRRTPYPQQAQDQLKEVFGWVDDAYDKIPAENVVMGDPVLAGTVLRLPFVYGPGDQFHRLFPIVKRIDDGRRKLVFSEDLATWRGLRAFVENVAAAIVLAATSEKAVGRVYNVCEEPAFTELDWATRVADQARWRGEFVVVPTERAPQHLKIPANLSQHWVASSARIRQELGFRDPITLDEAITRTIAWERAHPPEVIPQQFDYAAEDAAA